MRKIDVILDAGAGPIGQQTVSIPDGEDESIALEQWLRFECDWTLRAGDIIKFVEQQS